MPCQRSYHYEVNVVYSMVQILDSIFYSLHRSSPRQSVGLLFFLYTPMIERPNETGFVRVTQTFQSIFSLPHQPGQCCHWVQSLNGGLGVGQIGFGWCTMIQYRQYLRLEYVGIEGSPTLRLSKNSDIPTYDTLPWKAHSKIPLQLQLAC